MRSVLRPLALAIACLIHPTADGRRAPPPNRALTPPTPSKFWLRCRSLLAWPSRCLKAPMYTWSARRRPICRAHVRSSYFTGRGAPALSALAQDADAAIGLRSLWADDPLYPVARRSNIRIVEVDAARPVDGGLPGIALRTGRQRRLEQPALAIEQQPGAHGRCVGCRPEPPGGRVPRPGSTPTWPHSNSACSGSTLTARRGWPRRTT